MGCRAGAGRADIVFPDAVFPVEGFVGERDPLRARVVLLDDGSLRIALAAIDQISIRDESLARIRHVITGVTGLPARQIVVSATHTFAAPHILPTNQVALGNRDSNECLQQAVDDAVRRAATDALAQLQPARIGFGLGRCGVNVNRDVPTAEGWWFGANEAGVSDRSVAVISVDDLAGQPIALLVNYAVQSSVMHDSVTSAGSKLITADLAGAATRHIEEHHAGAVALFLIGAAADQAPYLTANRHVIGPGGHPARIDVHEAGFLLVDLLGERLGAEAVRVREQITETNPVPTLAITTETVTLQGQVMQATEDIRPATAYQFTPTGPASAPVTIARIGDIALVGVQAELTSATGLDIKRRSPFERTVVMTMTNGAAKYMADEPSFDRITYAAMSSPYARSSAETFTAAVAELLQRIA